MIPGFRRALLEIEEDSQIDKKDNMIYQLKLIFGGLMEIEKEYYNPKKFCFAFKDIDGSPIDPLI